MKSNLVDLEALLRAQKLDGTLVSSRPLPAERLAATGIGSLDAQLDGGLVRGHLSEIVGCPSSGRTSVLCAMLASATQRGEVVALIDTFDTFDPASGQATADLSRLLTCRACSGSVVINVRRSSGRVARCRGTLVAPSKHRVLWRWPGVLVSWPSTWLMPPLRPFNGSRSRRGGECLARSRAVKRLASSWDPSRWDAARLDVRSCLRIVIVACDGWGRARGVESCKGSTSVLASSPPVIRAADFDS